MAELILILGGARSGKSSLAERLAGARGRVTYLATATAGDDEMTERIARHRAERVPGWRTVECPADPAAAIRETAADTDCFLLDCLTLLVSNLLVDDEARGEARVQATLEALLSAHAESGADLIIVSNEVGLGLVPPTPLGRVYRDVLGRANQYLAARAAKAYCVIAGLPVELKALACDI